MHGTIGLKSLSTVATVRAASGLHAATVDTGEGERRTFPGYLSEGEALSAGRRFALALGVAECGEPVDAGFDYVPHGRHGDDKRRARRAVRAGKSAWLDSIR